MKKTLILLLISTCLTLIGKAQLNKNYLGLGIGYNLLTFKGDLNPNTKDNRFNNFRSAFDINVEKRFNNYIGVSGNFLHGKLSQQDFKSNSGLNFESKATNFNLKAILFFDNDLLLNKEITFTPFIKIGAGLLLFDPYSDLKDVNGESYHFWKDGSIKSIDENDENAINALPLKRDYEYETQLSSAQKAVTIPISLGFTAKINDNIGFRIEAGYNFTTSDNIDNIKSGSNDKFMISKIGLIFALNKRNSDQTDENHHLNFDFDFLHKHDTDNDGVADFHDHCQNTPEDIETDKNGCPLDEDNDLVPDYLDKELESEAGAHVDENGVTMTDDHFLNKHLEKDSVMFMNRIKQLIEAPDLETLHAIDRQVEQEIKAGTHLEMPDNLKISDTNKDGIIQSEEMLNAIDSFLDGDLDITIATLYELIDYFFEQ